MKDLFDIVNKITSTVVKEALYVNRPEYYYNFDKYENGESNVCLITGIVGSNYRDVAYKLAHKFDKTIVVELCDVYYCPEPNQSDLVYRAFVEKYPNLKEQVKEMIKQEMFRLVEKYMFFALSLAKVNPTFKFLIVGPEIFWNINAYIDDLLEYPAIFVNTSLIKSLKHDAEIKSKRGISKKEIIKDYIKRLSVYTQDYDLFTNMQNDFKMYSKYKKIVRR